MLVAYWQVAMFLIRCPWCGERDVSDFAYGGEAHIARPTNAEAMSDAEWAGYVFLRSNPKGVHRRALEPPGRLPPLVQHAPQHRDRRHPRRLQDRRAAPGRSSATCRATPSGEASIGSGNDAVKVDASGGSGSA